LNYTGHVKVPMALPIDPNHNVTVILQQQTGLKQNVGITMLQPKEKFKLSGWSITNTLNFQNKLKFDHDLAIGRAFYDN
jgi:hypothetical protein